MTNTNVIIPRLVIGVDSSEALAPSNRLECSDWAHRQRHGGQGSGGAACTHTGLIINRRLKHKNISQADIKYSHWKNLSHKTITITWITSTSALAKLSAFSTGTLC